MHLAEGFQNQGHPYARKRGLHVAVVEIAGSYSQSKLACELVLIVSEPPTGAPASKCVLIAKVQTVWVHVYSGGAMVLSLDTQSSGRADLRCVGCTHLAR